MVTKAPVHVRYGKTLCYYTNRNREYLWFETLGAPYFLAGELLVQFRDGKNLGGKIFTLAGWGGCGDLDGLNGGINGGFKTVKDRDSITVDENFICVAILSGIFRDIVSAKTAAGIMNIIRQLYGDEFITGNTGWFLALKNPASRKAMSLIQIV